MLKNLILFKNFQNPDGGQNSLFSYSSNGEKNDEVWILGSHKK